MLIRLRLPTSLCYSCCLCIQRIFGGLQMLTFKVMNVMKSRQNVKLSNSSDRWSQELLKHEMLNSISPGCVRSPLWNIFSYI